MSAAETIPTANDARGAHSLRRGVMPRLEALDLVALRIDEIQKQGTPEHAKAARIADKAVEQWKRDFHTRCPHCGARHNAGADAPATKDL